MIILWQIKDYLPAKYCQFLEAFQSNGDGDNDDKWETKLAVKCVGL